jgi:hypothetical protein
MNFEMGERYATSLWTSPETKLSFGYGYPGVWCFGFAPAGLTGGEIEDASL